MNDQADEKPTATPVIQLTCRFCKKPPSLCEEHAGALVAQAFAEDSDNRRDAAARAAERELRRGADDPTADARAIRHVLVRWHRSRALEVAREIVRLLETEQ